MTLVEANDELESTKYDNVLWKGPSSRGANRERNAALREGKKIAQACDNVLVIVSVGPYRSHDVHWEHIGTEEDTGKEVIELDYYSVRPGYGYTDEIIDDIQREL